MLLRTRIRGSWAGAALCALYLAVGLTGCARTHQTRQVPLAGFLKDYSQLRKGQGDEPQLVYINPSAKFAAYKKVMIEPPTIWQAGRSKLSRVSKEGRDRLVSHLYWTVRRQLEGHYTVVQRPGPGVMRLRMALTEARRSKPIMDLVTTVLPPAVVVSAAQRLVTGTNAFVGKAAVEAEIVDSVTGERLMAAVDERAGRKVLRGKLDTWDDVDSAYDYWAERLKTRLR